MRSPMSAFIRPTLLRFFSPTQVLRKAAPGEQLGLFGAERKPVRRPGSRGGKYWVTQRATFDTASGRCRERRPTRRCRRPKAAPLVLPPAAARAWVVPRYLHRSGHLLSSAAGARADGVGSPFRGLT